MFFFYCYAHPRDLHSFPTRRSSDLCRLATLSVSIRRLQPFWRTCAILNTSRPLARADTRSARPISVERSEEHTSELQSRENLVCRLLLEKKKEPPMLHYHSSAPDTI